MEFADLDIKDVDFTHMGKFVESEVGGKRYANISLAAGKFSLIDKDNNITPLQEKLKTKNGMEVEVPQTSIEVYIVGLTPKVARTYYANTYAPGVKSLPDCYSHNGITPSPRVISPISSSCQICPKAAKGSLVQDGKTGTACKIKKHLIVILNNDFNIPYRLTLSAGSAINFNDYVAGKNKSKIASIPLAYIKTTITYLDKDQHGRAITYARLGFSFAGITNDIKIRNELNQFGIDGEKKSLIDDMLGLNEVAPPSNLVATPVSISDKLETIELPSKRSALDADIAAFNADGIPF